MAKNEEEFKINAAETIYDNNRYLKDLLKMIQFLRSGLIYCVHLGTSQAQEIINLKSLTFAFTPFISSLHRNLLKQTLPQLSNVPPNQHL